MPAFKNALETIHAFEGRLLSKMGWRRKRNAESWPQLFQSVYLAARGALKAALMPSAVQLFLFKKWCWAKDLAMTSGQHRTTTDEYADAQLYRSSRGGG
eukprot:1359620-Pyramimonas_sp.AAC.1